MQVIGNIPMFGSPIDPGSMEQIFRARSQGVGAALMADHHKGYGVPIGGVVAYENAVSPTGVGYDIACGNKAVCLDADVDDVTRNIRTIMDDIFRTISFGIGRKNQEEVDHDLFSSPVWSLDAVKGLKDLARAQLGTVGSGNHFVDIFVDDDRGKVWIGVHFGSRGLGHKTATWFLKKGRADNGMDAMPLVFDLEKSPLGDEYLLAMELAGQYAYAGRDWVCERVAKIIGAKITDSVHNHHNYAWKEPHGGRELWVVRKGATPAWPGQRSFVGGTMGEDSVILEGILPEEGANTEWQKAAFYSTVHGAGRVMSRTQAKGKYHRKTGEIIRPGEISRNAMNEWIEKAGVELRGGDLDEAPQAYKRLATVLAYHVKTVRATHRLRPIGVAMAGKGDFDPYKD